MVLVNYKLEAKVRLCKSSLCLYHQDGDLGARLKNLYFKTKASLYLGVVITTKVTTHQQQDSDQI